MLYKSIEGENKRDDTETEGEIENESENKMVDTESEGEIDRVDYESTNINFHVDKGSLS